MTFRTIAAALLLMLVASPAHAASYIKADFSAGVFGGDANVTDPLRDPFFPSDVFTGSFVYDQDLVCLLYTSDAADERSSVDLGGRRIIKKKKTQTNTA